MRYRPWPIKIISTFFYLGCLPAAPGTFGSLAGLALYYLLKGNCLAYILFSAGLLIIGVLIGSRAESEFGKKDPKQVVIDEVAGMLFSLMLIPPDLRLVIIGFLIFRLLDILKPYPASVFQDAKGGIGIMGDDFICALYTNIVLQLILRFTSFKIS